MDFRKILTDSAVSLLRKLVVMARGILVVPIITKLLGVDIYGIWTLIFAIITIFTGVGGLHLHGTLVRYKPTEAEPGQAVSDLLLIAGFAAVVAGALFPVAIDAIGLSIPSGSVWGMDIPTIAGLIVAAKIVGLVLKNIPRSEGRVKEYELVTLTERTLETVALVVTLTITRDIVAGLLAILLTISASYIAILLLYLPGRVRWPDTGNFRRYLSYSTPMVVREFSSKLLAQSDKFLILFFLSPVDVGIYSVAFGVSALVPGLTRVFNSTLYPSVTSAWEEGRFDEIQTFYDRFLSGYVLLVVPAVFGITLLASPILRLLATPEVARKGWILVPVITVAFVFRGFEHVITYLLNATEETEKVAIADSLALIVNLALNVLLIPIIGLMGAAVAMAVSMAIRLGYIYHHVDKHVPIPIPTGRLLKSVFSAGVMAAILLYVVFKPDWVVLQLILYPLVGAVVYFGVVYYVGGLTERDINLVRSLF